MKEDILLVGGGGHCRACIDVIEAGERYRILGIIDRTERLHEKVLGYEIIATDDDLPNLVKESRNFLVTVGQIRSPEKRIQLYNTLKTIRAHLPVIVSPFAHVSSHARVGEGSIVMHHALVNASAKIGLNCVINTKAVIEHDTRVGDHCHISTGVVLNGGVIIGAASFVGSFTMVKEGVIVGPGSIIGAGSAIFKNIAPASAIRNHGNS